MKARWTEQDIARVNARLGAHVAAPLDIQITKPLRRTGRNKYNAKKTYFQAQVFDSKREFRRWQELELERVAGKIRALVRQVSFRLPNCDRRIRLDFMIVENDGRIRFADAKGKATYDWQVKRDLVEQAFGIKIEIL